MRYCVAVFCLVVPAIPATFICKLVLHVLCKLIDHDYIYLRQVHVVNVGDTVFV